jgi:hypothetical protein
MGTISIRRVVARGCEMHLVLRIAYQRAALAIFGALVLQTPADAGFLSWVDRAGEIAGSLAEHGSSATARFLKKAAEVAKQMGVHSKFAIAEAVDKNTIHFLAPRDGNIIAELRSGSQDSTRSIAALAGYHIAIPEEFLVAHPDTIRWLLKQPFVRTSVLSDDGLWPLRLEHAADRDIILVEASPTLGFTVDAFIKRQTLESLSARPLVTRMRVIPLVSRSDPGVAEAFRLDVRNAAPPPVTRADALKLISQSREKLLVIAGHVEGNDFVVRSLTGQEEFHISIDAIYHGATVAKSEVLLLGCRVACATTHTGPVHDITADGVIKALSMVDPNANALAFLKQLADKAGPLLIQDDHRGGFLVIDDAVSRQKNLKWSIGIQPVRLAILAADSENNEPWAQRVLLGPTVVILIVSLSGWLLLLFMSGLGPRRAWRSVKQQRALVRKLDDELSPVPRRVIVMYILFGPWSIIWGLCVYCFTVIIVWLMVYTCAPLGLVILGLPLFPVFRARRVWKHITSEPRPSFSDVYMAIIMSLVTCSIVVGIIMYCPYAFFVTIYYHHPIAAFFSLPDTVPLAIGFILSSVVFALTIWMRFWKFIGICAATNGVLLGWPAWVLGWLEKGLMSGFRRYVA